METFIDQFTAFFMGIFSLAQGGFEGVNQILGLLIALVAALLMPFWSRLWASAAGATVVHILVGVLEPVLDGGAFVLPNILTLTFWMTALALFLGYAIVIAVFFFIKTLVTRRGYSRRHVH